MPSNIAQADLIRDTYVRAGLDIDDPKDRPQFFHAHGTGTPAGDPQEAEAISRAFFEGGKVKDPLYVGSIKTIIGYVFLLFLLCFVDTQTCEQAHRGRRRSCQSDWYFSSPAAWHHPPEFTRTQLFCSFVAPSDIVDLPQEPRGRSGVTQELECFQ